MGAVWSYARGEKTLREGAFYKAYKINDQLGQKLLSVGIGKNQLFELHEIFNIMDRDHSGEINLSEFFNYVDIKRTRFSEKAFSVMDRDGSGEVDFIEFVLAVWNYCSFNRSSLVRYAFDLYDTDSSGEIELKEASQCVREIWGSEWEHNANAQKVMAKLEGIMQSTASGRLTIQLFQEFAQHHPMLLFPAFQLQTEIQHRVLGERFWQKAAKRRSQIDPKELNFHNFEKLVHLSHQTSQKLLQTVDDVLHDNIFEEIQPAPLARKRSSLQTVLTKVRSRRKKVFLESKVSTSERRGDNDGDGNSIVTTFESPAPSSTSAKAMRNKSSVTRPRVVETVSLPLANDSVSSFTSSGPITGSTHSPSTEYPTAASPKKKKKMKPKSHLGAAKADLVVEDVLDGKA